VLLACFLMQPDCACASGAARPEILDLHLQGRAGDRDLAHAATSAPRLVRLSRVQKRLADELASGHLGPCSLLADGDSSQIAENR